MSDLKDVLEMTGCRDAADLQDMANVGKALMERMADVVEHGPLKGWMPADCPTEIVTDLANEVDEALKRQEEARDDACKAIGEMYAARAQVEAMRKALEPFAACAEHDIGETEDDADTFRNSTHNRAPKITVGDLRRARAALSGSPEESAVYPGEPGGFIGDIYFGDPDNTTRGTHRWTGSAWEPLPSDAEVLMELLAQARAERDEAIRERDEALELADDKDASADSWFHEHKKSEARVVQEMEYASASRNIAARLHKALIDLNAALDAYWNIGPKERGTGGAIKAIEAAQQASLVALTAPTEARTHQLPGLCEDCPPVGYPTDKTRCSPCPRRARSEQAEGGQ